MAMTSMMAAHVLPLMVAAPMALLMAVMMAASGLRVIGQLSFKKSFYRFIRAARHPAVQPDAHGCQRRSGTAADTSADQHICIKCL